MIATLEGKVAEKLADHIIIDVGGVGYGVLVTAEDHGTLKSGSIAKLFIYEHIREQSHDLFGFTSREAKKFFELLLGVNGIGPKMALNVLGIGTAQAVKAAIANGDTKYIQAAQGVGKRVAERIVVDLKDKVGLVSSADDTALFMSDAQANKDEALQALVALGYSMQDAAVALKDVDTALPTEERIKQALAA